MLYLQQFQNNRVDCLKQYQRLHSSLDENFSLCSNQYSEKFPKLSRIKPSNIDYSRDQTLFFLSKNSSTDMVGIKKNVFRFCSSLCLDVSYKKIKEKVTLIRLTIRSNV